MSPRNMFFFFKLSALRIANLPSGSRSLGTYRTLVRQYAEEFGIRAEIETADDACRPRASLARGILAPRQVG